MASAWGLSWGPAWGNSWGSVSGVVSTRDTHDGGLTRDQIRRLYGQAQRARTRSDEERRASELRLAQALERAYRRLNGLPEFIEAFTEAGLPLTASDGMMPSVPNWEALATNLAMLEQAMALAEEARFARLDEDDIDVILMTLH